MATLVKDMTHGRETPLLLRFMLPMLLGNLFQQVYNLADSVIVGQHEGANALGSIGCTGSITFLFFSFCNGLSMGAGILIAQYFGSGRGDKVKQTLANAFYIQMISGVLLSIIGYLSARPILTLLKTPAGQIDGATTYLEIVCLGTLAVSLYNYAAQTMRALGDSRTPLIFLIVACLINVFLDLLLVVGLDMGVMGAALATVLSQCISAICSLLYGFWKNPYFKLKREHLRFDREISAKCFQIGLPLAAQSILISISCVILQRVVNGFEEAVVSAFTATTRIEQLVQQPFNSLGSAVSTFTGQNMGAGKTDRVKTAFHKSIWIAAVISLSMLIACYAAGSFMIRCFVNDPEVIRIGAMGLRITSLMFFPLGMIYITRGLLNGAGDAFYAMINGAVEVTGRVGFSLLLVVIFPIGIRAVWFATGLTWVITALAGIIRYRQGKWLKYHLN